MAKRKRQRNKGASMRQEFAQITYYYETFSWNHIREYSRSVYGTDQVDLVPLAGGGKVKYVKRMFKTYDAAIAHLTSIKLGLKEETHPYNNYTAHKLLWGYRHRGQKIVQHTKILQKVELKHERDSIRRSVASGRLVSQQRSALPAFPKALQTTEWGKRVIANVRWRSRAAAAGYNVTPMGRGWAQIRTVSETSSGNIGTATNSV